MSLNQPLLLSSALVHQMLLNQRLIHPNKCPFDPDRLNTMYLGDFLFALAFKLTHYHPAFPGRQFPQTRYNRNRDKKTRLPFAAGPSILEGYASQNGK